VVTFKITVAYDGSGFVGWQRQAHGTSIQGLIEDAVGAFAGRAVVVHGAGRTDAGVHALGQVASFTIDRDIDAGTVVRATNARLPDSVRVLDAEPVDPRFHARHSARGKTYAYRILNRRVPDVFQRAYVWHVAAALDADAMASAARPLAGRHDFAAFQASGASTHTTERTVRAISISPPRRTQNGDGSMPVGPFAGLERDVMTIEIAGDGFLRHMVRTIVGSLVEIGSGRREPEWLGRVLASRDRALAGPTAPASGLFLVRVAYDADPLADEC